MPQENKLELTTDNILYLWSKTYNTDGKPDWSHIFPYYSEDIVFHDSIQKIEGKDDFVKMCKRLTKRSKELKMNIVSIVKEKNTVMMDWEMTMIFRHAPRSTIYGATKLTINDANEITHQRDYYDLWGDIYRTVPVYRGVYKWFMKTFFG